MVECIKNLFRELFRPYRKNKRKEMKTNEEFNKTVNTIVSSLSDNTEKFDSEISIISDREISDSGDGFDNESKDTYQNNFQIESSYENESNCKKTYELKNESSDSSYSEENMNKRKAYTNKRKNDNKTQQRNSYARLTLKEKNKSQKNELYNTKNEYSQEEDIIDYDSTKDSNESLHFYKKQNKNYQKSYDKKSLQKHNDNKKVMYKNHMDENNESKRYINSILSNNRNHSKSSFNDTKMNSIKNLYNRNDTSRKDMDDKNNTLKRLYHKKNYSKNEDLSDETISNISSNGSSDLHYENLKKKVNSYDEILESYYEEDNFFELNKNLCSKMSAYLNRK